MSFFDALLAAITRFFEPQQHLASRRRPFRRKPAAKARTQPARARLAVETLEDRTLLSATAFSPATLLSLLPQGATLVPGIVVADFTGDGKPDVAAGFTNGNAYPNDPAQIAVFPGIGGGMFGAPQTFDAGTGSGGGSLATGDFNNDGHPDLVLTAGESNGN